MAQVSAPIIPKIPVIIPGTYLAVSNAIIRLIPGALTDETSALSDCFQDDLLSPPVYTRPAEFNGWKVPEVLLSGNPKLIQAWQDEQALERTKRLRPGLLSEVKMSDRKIWQHY